MTMNTISINVDVEVDDDALDSLANFTARLYDEVMLTVEEQYGYVGQYSNWDVSYSDAYDVEEGI